MKEFKYRWKIGGGECVGTRVCIDEAYLKNHVKKMGGELIEILEIKEKTEIKELHPELGGRDALQTGVFPGPTQFDGKDKKRMPSVGIKIFGWLYIVGAILTYVMFAYLYFVKGVTPTMKFAAKIITGGQANILIDIFVAIFGMALAVTGTGLLRLKKWARIIVLVFAWLNIMNSVYSIFFGHINLPLGAIFTIWFFSRESIRCQFNEL